MDVKVSGEPVRPACDAMVVWGPAVGPRVRVMLATPSKSVVLVAAPTDPPPVPTAHEMATFETGRPPSSVTNTSNGLGSAVPAGATWLLPPSTAISAGAGPGPPPSPAQPRPATATITTQFGLSKDMDDSSGACRGEHTPRLHLGYLTG